MQKDLIIKRISLYDEVLKSREKFRLPPPNILCICDHYAKVLHDVMLFHHFHAPPFPKRFRFRMISMFNYIIYRAMLLSKDLKAVLMIPRKVIGVLKFSSGFEHASIHNRHGVRLYLYLCSLETGCVGEWRNLAALAERA